MNSHAQSCKLVYVSAIDCHVKFALHLLLLMILRLYHPPPLFPLLVSNTSVNRWSVHSMPSVKLYYCDFHSLLRWCYWKKKKKKKKTLPDNAGRHKRHSFDPWVGKIPWRRERQPTPVVLPGESQRSLAGYCPCSLKESDTTEVA